MSEAVASKQIRACGSCTMCCKVYPIPEMQKPKHAWCRECNPGKGCKSWTERPQMCADFYCQWVQDASLGEEWRPDRAGFVLALQGKHLAITCDTGTRGGWKKEPYYSSLKAASLQLFRQGIMVIVSDAGFKTLITPDQDEVLCRDGEKIEFELLEQKIGPATRWVVVKQVLTGAA